MNILMQVSKDVFSQAVVFSGLSLIVFILCLIGLIVSWIKELDIEMFFILIGLICVCVLAENLPKVVSYLY
jgi:hypothetical protein